MRANIFHLVAVMIVTAGTMTVIYGICWLTGIDFYKASTVLLCGILFLFWFTVDHNGKEDQEEKPRKTFQERLEEVKKQKEGGQ